MEKKNKIYKIVKSIGRIKEVRQAKGNHTEEIIYKLIIEENKDLKSISVYQRKANEKIWDEVLKGNCIGKKYVFSCIKVGNAHHLKEWRETE